MVITAAASGMLLASAAQAEQKIALVNFQEIMGKIPQTAQFMKVLEAEIKDDKAVITQLERDIKYYQEKEKRDSSLMTEKEKKELVEKVAGLFKSYKEKGEALNKRITARQNEETNKIVAIVRQVIDNIATKNDYDLVIDQKAAIFSKPEASITNQVVEQVSKLK